MSNKKKVPVAGKTVAGKNNSNKKKETQRKKAEAEKYARRVAEEKERKQKAQQKRSEEIHKQRQKINAKETKATEKKTKREKKKFLRKKRRAKFVKRFKYYTSKKFLSSLNYFRIFTCIVLPIALIIAASVCVSQSVFRNVPSEVRATEFNGRLESEAVAKESVFNTQQQQVFIEALKAKGSKSFSFYFNTVINVGDDFSTDNLCFGNPKTNDCIMIATVYDGDGNVLYRSLGLEPGMEINNVKLFRELSYGVHDVKVAVNAYDKKSKEKIGTKYAKIKIAVGVEYNGEN